MPSTLLTSKAGEDLSVNLTDGDAMTRQPRAEHRRGADVPPRDARRVPHLLERDDEGIDPRTQWPRPKANTNLLTDVQRFKHPQCGLQVGGTL
jgi:hypothetical protein